MSKTNFDKNGWKSTDPRRSSAGNPEFAFWPKLGLDSRNQAEFSHLPYLANSFRKGMDCDGVFAACCRATTLLPVITSPSFIPKCRRRDTVVHCFYYCYYKAPKARAFYCFSYLPAVIRAGARRLANEPSHVISQLWMIQF